MASGQGTLPSDLPHAFRVSTALARGATRRRMRGADLASPFWGVRTRSDVVEDIDSDLDLRERAALARIRAYAPRMSSLAFLTHESSALLWRLPIPLYEGMPVHAGVLHPHRAPRGAGVRGHEIAAHLVAIRELDGIRVSSPAATWAQLAAKLSLRDLVAVGDAIIRIPRGPGGVPGTASAALGTVEQLRAAALAGKRRGAARIREALPLLRPGASSRPESHLRLELIACGLPEPELDVEIRTLAGALLGISEVVFPRWRTVVEYEGDHHRTLKSQWNRDIDKYDAYRAAGWQVVRITAEHLYGDGATAGRRVREALIRQGWRP
jgi:hypothetical protein